MRLSASYICFLVTILAVLSACRGPTVAEESNHPIIADLIANPQKFDDELVVVYGLVIDASDEGRRFTLQDVSQIPLAIIAPIDTPAKVGEELLVHGVFHSGKPPHIEGHRLVPTKVLGGGGCC